MNLVDFIILYIMNESCLLCLSGEILQIYCVLYSNNSIGTGKYYAVHFREEFCVKFSK